jgi:hypothetical protein
MPHVEIMLAESAKFITPGYHGDWNGSSLKGKNKNQPIENDFPLFTGLASSTHQ